MVETCSTNWPDRATIPNANFLNGAWEGASNVLGDIVTCTKCADTFLGQVCTQFFGLCAELPRYFFEFTHARTAAIPMALPPSEAVFGFDSSDDEQSGRAFQGAKTEVRRRTNWLQCFVIGRAWQHNEE